MDREACRAAIHGVTKSQIRLRDWNELNWTTSHNYYVAAFAVIVKTLKFYFHNSFWMCVYISSVQSVSHVWLSGTPWTAAHQASLSITNSQSLLKLMSIKSVMPMNHLILHHPLLLLPSILPSIRGFSNGSVLHLRWPKYWSFNFRISPSNEYSGLTSLRMD